MNTLFTAMVLKPFFAVCLMLPARYVQRYLQRNMREGPLKTALLRKRGEAMNQWFVRKDEVMIRWVKRQFRW